MKIDRNMFVYQTLIKTYDIPRNVQSMHIFYDYHLLFASKKTFTMHEPELYDI